MFFYMEILLIKYFDIYVYGDLMSFYINDIDVLR